MSVFEKSAGLTPVFNHLKCTLFYTIFKNSIKADLSSHSIKADMLIDKKLVPRLILSKKWFYTKPSDHMTEGLSYTEVAYEENVCFHKKCTESENSWLLYWA